MQLRTTLVKFQDRYEIGVVSRMKQDWAALRGVTYTQADRHYRKWQLWRIGNYTSNGALFSVMLRSRSDRERPDLFCFAVLADFRGYYPAYSERIKKLNYLSWIVLKAYAANDTGTVRLASASPFERPRIEFNSFGQETAQDRDDLRAVVTGIKFVRRVADAMGDLVAEEETPGRHVFTDEQLGQYVRDTTWGHHACGTCAMKPRDQGGVVDSRFRVYGVANLRIVDASVMPTITSGNTNAPTMMIAEKGAAMMLEDARPSV